MAFRAHICMLLCLLPFAAPAQRPVAPCTDWLATVDEASQQIVLSWRPSTDTAAMGYHICTGSPCLDFDTVFGRFDTIYTCLPHSATEPHLYRLHVFDSARNVSSLTPSFGNIVLQAESTPCDSVVNLVWTPYQGMPGGLSGYRVLAKLEPFNADFVALGMVDTLGPLAYTVHLSSPVTRVWVKVQAFSADRRLVSQSNVVEIERLTSDTADFVEISSVEYDSIRIFNHLVFNTDTSYPTDHYTLLRSIDGSPWREVATLEPPVLEYIDRDINPYDSLHCYLLAVNDACGMNPKYSPVECIVVPTPPEPSVYFPNAILAGDPANGTFLPVIRGLQGTLYELHIYNRQGMLVYHTTDPTRGWTPPADTPQGVYTYRLRCRFNTNFVKQYLGTVLLIK